MTVSDLPVEGPRPWPGTSAHQFDSAGLTEAHRHWRCRGRILDQELDGSETSTLGIFGPGYTRHQYRECC